MTLALSYMRVTDKPEIKSGKNPVTIRGQRQVLYFQSSNDKFMPNDEAEALFVKTKTRNISR